MYQDRRTSTLGMTIGICVSLIGHLLLAVVVIVVLETSAAEAIRAPEVFTVTLEGGEVLGGVTNIPKELPKDNNQTQIPEAGPDDEPEAPEEAPEEETPPDDSLVLEQKKKEQEEAKKKAEDEAKSKAEEAKRKAEEQKRKAEEEKKRKAEEAKKKAEQDAKRKAEEAKRQAEEERKARAARRKKFDKRMAELRKGIKKADGESYDAGGVGMGAARFQAGGKGRGGGTLTSLEKLSYMNALEQHVKRGWRWINSNQKLTAAVRFRILPNGSLQNIRLERSSGNGNFDDSVIRAVNKAVPVPAPPAKYVAEFSDVRIIFDSKE